MRDWLWNLWFERLYLPRHPYHSVTPGALFMWRKVLWGEEFTLATEEYNWLEPMSRP